MYYTLPDPPYFLVVVGLFIGMTSGAAFEATLKNKVQLWAKNPKRENLDLLKSLELQLPFWGICGGICVFLASGLELFSINPLVAYAISLPLTLLIASLVWSQLGDLLIQLEKGGSRALDLDAY